MYPSLSEQDLYKIKLQQMMQSDPSFRGQAAPIAQISPNVQTAPVEQVAQNFHRPQIVLPDTQASQTAPQQPVIPPTIQPVAAQPNQATFESMKAPVATDPQFKNSRLRTVLNAIAGGLAGAAGGPEAGIKVGSALHDSKYNRAMQDFNTQFELKKAQAGSEAGRMKSGETAALLPSKIDASDALAGQRRTNTVLAPKEFERKQAETASKAKDREVRQKRLQDKLDQLPAEFRNMKALNDLSDDEKEKYLDTYLQMHPKETTSEKTQAAIDVKSTPENLAKQAKTAQATGMAGASGRALGTAEGEIAAEKLPENQSRIESYAKQLNDNPDQYYNQIDKVPPKLKAAVTEAFLAKNNDIVNKLPPTQHTAVANSQVALKHADNIQRLFDDPDIKNNWGPIHGRMNQIMSKYGGKSLNDPAEQQAAYQDIMSTGAKLGITGKEQELMGYLAYLVTYEASSASGTRPSWQLINFLKSEASPQPRMERDRFQGAINVVRGSAVARIKGAFDKTKSGMPMASDANKTVDSDGWDWGAIKVHN